jgi:hypothetical protein
MPRARLSATSSHLKQRPHFGDLLPFDRGGHLASFPFWLCKSSQTSALVVLGEANSHVAIEGVVTGHE